MIYVTYRHTSKIGGEAKETCFQEGGKWISLSMFHSYFYLQNYLDWETPPESQIKMKDDLKG